MNRHSVVFTPEAEEQLAELFHYIEENAASDVALRYTRAVVEYCEGLETFPEHIRFERTDEVGHRQAFHV